MRAHLRPLALACALAALPGLAAATDLLQAWQAAQQHDRTLAVARAAHAAAQPQRDQAAALWRPGVALTAAAGVANGETQMHGAQFSAPGMGPTNGANVATSITGGTATRWQLQASQPLYNPQRRAQQQQLRLQADMADLQWQAQQQQAMLRTAQRYLDVAVAQEALRVIDQQHAAVQKAAEEAQERYRVGSAPITDTHEASARLAALRASQVAAQVDLDVKRRLLADATGLPAATLQARLPAAPASELLSTALALEAWQQQAEDGNPGIRLHTLAAEAARAEARKHSLGAAPSVDLVAQAGQERLHGSGAYGTAQSKNLSAMVGVQLTVPLYTGGWRSAKEEESLRLQDKAEAETLSTREQVAQQVQAAWLGLRMGAQRVHALEQAQVASRARLDATQTGHEVGDRTLLDLLNAQNDDAATALALAQARSALLIDHLRLALLAGQLDEARLRAVNQAMAPAQ